MQKNFLIFNALTFEYPDSVSTIFADISLQLGQEWTGIVGANGTGKTTLLKIASGLIQPTTGHIQAPEHVIYCEQRTDSMPPDLPNLLKTPGKESHRIIDMLDIQPGWIHRWDTLSHGERKRAQIGTALWQEPDLLAIDEPTNHVDAHARDILLESLKSYKGIGLLVSHDRTLLDTLCEQCLFIDPPDVKLRPGGYTKGILQEKDEQTSALRDRNEQKRVYRKLKREANQRRKLADKAKKLRSKRGIHRKDHDAKSKVDMARLSGKDATGGKLLRQMENRVSRAEKALNESRVKKDHQLGIWLPGSVSHKDFLHSKSASTITFGRRRLQCPELNIGSTDRIGLSGINGSGKSTLVNKLVEEIGLPDEHLAYIPQEISVEETIEIHSAIQGLTHDELGHVMTIISRLGSRPERVLDTSLPSPGETRKLLLALGMTRLPHLIIMDEPTNHMDLPSIDSLEAALSDCPCALLLVSHDEMFLKNLTSIKWDIQIDSQDPDLFRLNNTRG